MQERKRSLPRVLWKQRTLCLMILPAIILLFMFNYLPLYGLTIAFRDFNYRDGIWNSPWIGLKNFRILLVSGKTMLRLVKNTFMYYAVFTALGTICNIALAIMLNECHGKHFARYSHTVMILPTFLSWVAVTYIAKAFLGTSDGLINNVRAALGQKPVNWYLSAGYWPAILTIIQIWKSTGYGAIMYLSALCGMDPAIFEAATIDGAAKAQQIRYLTLPMLRPLVSIMLLLSLGGIMTSNTGLFYRVTLNTGILYSTTQTIDAYIINAVTQGTTQYGLTSAVSFFQSMVGFVMVVGTNLIVRRVAPENALF